MAITATASRTGHWTSGKGSGTSRDVCSITVKNTYDYDVHITAITVTNLGSGYGTLYGSGKKFVVKQQDCPAAITDASGTIFGKKTITHTIGVSSVGSQSKSGYFKNPEHSAKFENKNGYRIPKNSSVTFYVVPYDTTHPSGSTSGPCLCCSATLSASVSTKKSGSPSAPSKDNISLSSTIYYQENYSFYCKGTHKISNKKEHECIQYQYRDLEGKWLGWSNEALSDNTTSYNGKGIKPENYSAVQWRIRNYDSTYATPTSSWVYSDIIQYTLRPPTMRIRRTDEYVDVIDGTIDYGTFTGPILYNDPYNSAGVCTNPTYLPKTAHQDWQWTYKDSNNGTYAPYPTVSGINKGGLQDNSYNKITHPFIGLRARVYANYFNTSSWCTTVYTQVYLRPPSDIMFGLNDTYYNDLYEHYIIAAFDSKNPTGVTPYYEYRFSDNIDKSNPSHWVNNDNTTNPSKDVLKNHIQHPWVQFRVQVRKEPYLPSSYVYTGDDYTQVKLNGPTDIQFNSMFITSPTVTVSYINNNEDDPLEETIYVGYRHSLDSDICTDANPYNKVPQGTKVYIKNSVDNEYVENGREFPSILKYNSCSCTGYYACPGYINSDNLIRYYSHNLKIVTAPELDNNFNVQFEYDGNILKQGDRVSTNKDKLITIKWSKFPSNLERGRFNYIRIYIINDEDDETLCYEGTTDAYLETSTDENRTVNISLSSFLGDDPNLKDRLYRIRIEPMYLSDTGELFLYQSSYRSLTSVAFYYGSSPSPVIPLYPASIYEGEGIRTISNRIPLCFKVPNPGEDMEIKGIASINIKLQKYNKDITLEPDSAELLTEEEITIGTSNFNNSSILENGQLKAYLTTYNNGSYIPYNYTGDILKYTDNIYITVVVNSDNDFVHADISDEDTTFVYTITSTNNQNTKTVSTLVIKRAIHPYINNLFKGEKLVNNCRSEVRSVVKDAIKYYQNVINQDVSGFDSKYPQDLKDSVIEAKEPKEWYEDYIMEIYNSKENNDSSGGFPYFDDIEEHPDNEGKIIAGNPIETSIESGEVGLPESITDQNLKMNLNPGEGMYYDIILKMFVDHI